MQKPFRFYFAEDDPTCPDEHQSIIEEACHRTAVNVSCRRLPAHHGWSFPDRWCFRAMFALLDGCNSIQGNKTVTRPEQAREEAEEEAARPYNSDRARNVDYGHRGRKATWLYCVGGDQPPGLKWGPAESGVRLDAGYHSTAERRAVASTNTIERLSPSECAATPIAFRDLLLNLAASGS